MSIGRGRYSSQSACDAANGSRKASIDSLRSVGIATVIAAGNDGYIDSTSAPGCLSSAVIVGNTLDAAGINNSWCGLGNGGTSQVDEVACDSNSASFLDLLAPGANIYSSVPGGGFENKWGTSMAAPHVAGCWAVLKQAQPSATVDQIVQALKSTGVQVRDWRNGIVTPRIDCKAALDTLLGSASSAPNLTINAFMVSPTTVSAGGLLTLAATVRNAGTASSSATTLRYYVWTGSVWSEIASCADSISTLSPEATSTQSCLITALATPGNSYYDVAVDAVPGESDTRDNSTNYVVVNVTAASIPTYPLTVTKAGTGSGTVTGAGITCGSDCTELYTYGTIVTLVATPSAGSSFTGWSGACVGANCQVTMTASKSMTANFAAGVPNLTISSFGISATTVNVGGMLTLSATVRNAGAGSGSATTLRYYRWTGNAWSEITGCRRSIGTLVPGATFSQSCAVAARSTPGADYFYTAVDWVAGESVTWDNAANYLSVTVVATYKPDLVVSTVTADGNAQAGSFMYASAVVKNQGSSSAGVSRINFFVSRDSTISTADTNTTWGCNTPALAPGTTNSCSGQIMIPISVLPGTYYIGAIADVDSEVSELDEGNNGRAAISPTVIGSALSIGEAVDNTTLAWSSGGNASWFGQTLTSYDGNDAAKSGDIEHWQSTWLQTTVSGPGTLSWYRKTSTEAGYDYLKVHLDGVVQSSLSTSGIADWAKVALVIPPGSHTVKWVYEKDGSVSLGSDAVWIDRVELSDGGVGSAYSRNYVQKAYVAYYGRPADPGGQSYWAVRMDVEGGSLNAIIGAFGHSDEFNRRYGGLTYTQLVTKIYQQALGRNPDAGGLNWYVAELQAGRRTLQTITLDVLNGATTAPDSTVVSNKLDVAAYYTAKVAAGCAYGTEQDGVNALSGVTADPPTVTSAKAAIDARCGP